MKMERSIRNNLGSAKIKVISPARKRWAKRMLIVSKVPSGTTACRAYGTEP